MKKFIVLFTLCVVTIAALAVMLLKPEPFTYTYGQHAQLLNTEWSKYEREDYCLANDLPPSFQVIYEGEYSLFINDTTAKAPRLPILNPDAIKSIAAVSSSVPFVVNPEASSEDFYVFDIDPNWLKKQSKGKNPETIKIRYLMSIEGVDELPTDIEPDEQSAFTTDLQDNTGTQQPKSKLIADQIKADLVKANDLSLYSLIKADCLWIKNHIAVPMIDNDDTLRPNYINIKNPEKTIALGLGVCEDAVYVLMKLLEHQGIQSQYFIGYVPNSLKQNDLMPANYTLHAQVLVKTSKGFYIVDPTPRATKEIRKMPLDNGTVIDVSGKQNDDLLSFPMFPIEIDDVYLPPSYVSFDLKQVRLIR